MLLNVRALQALAAYCVVLVHLLDSWNNYTGAHFNYPVFINGGFNSLFFVMSGFLIAKSTKGRKILPQQFLAKRLIRIIPLYWMLTAIVFIGTVFGLKPLGIESPDLHRLLLSLIFVPTF